jgi:hypothetical protein
MLLPSSLLEKEDELSTEKLSSIQRETNQPFARNPCATLYSGGQGYNGHMMLRDTSYTPNRSW